MIKKLTINNGNSNAKKNKISNKNFNQTEINANDTENKEINHTEANPYVIFPEIRATKNKYKPLAKKDSKNNTGISLPTIEK